ncbi:MAG: DUF2189 domain-containing protein [Betaproteobacteria bacterium]
MNTEPDPHDQQPKEHTPYEPPPPLEPGNTIATLRWSDPLVWLQRGWQDARRAKAIALFYGLCFWAMAVLLGAVFRHSPEYVISMASGCLLVGPFLAMGLYDVSRCHESGRVAHLGHSLICWSTNLRSMGLLVLVLIVMELLWGRASLVVFAVFFNTGMPSTTGVIEAVFSADNWEFLVAYLVVGSAFAGMVFATAAVSIPMILDRDTDAILAAITSLQVVFTNLGVMLLWGAVLTALVLAALLPWGLGLLLVGPWLGHATWHAYRGSVHWPDDTGPAPAP